jgi:hypothetical protein
MPSSFVIYPTPLSARVTLTPDGQPGAQGVAYTAPEGRQGQVCYVADGVTSGHGASLLVEATDYVPVSARGFLVIDKDVARLQVDDFFLTEMPKAPPPPDPVDPVGNKTAPQIIDEVYRTTHPNLATKEGCGRFTEDCCMALHEQHSEAWGHIHKYEGQNQFNGHAVDAVMLLGYTPDAQAGIYDIIFSSASPEASPAFNWAGPPDYALWYYPANAPTRGALTAPVVAR